MKKQTAETFWQKVIKRGDNECWGWNASIGTNGYPQVRWHGKNTHAHRVAAYLVGKLDSIDSKKWVLHLCDNPKCCNPNHLQIGDAAENSKQATERKRRNYHGELSPRALFTNKQTQKIRKLYFEKDMTQQQIADLVGAAQTTISRIVRYEGYKKC